MTEKDSFPLGTKVRLHDCDGVVDGTAPLVDGRASYRIRWTTGTSGWWGEDKVQKMVDDAGGTEVILKQLIEMRVDTERFDLTQWMDAAEFAGWANDEGNGIWYLAEDIADEHRESGLSFEIIASDPYVSES